MITSQLNRSQPLLSLIDTLSITTGELYYGNFKRKNEVRNGFNWISGINPKKIPRRVNTFKQSLRQVTSKAFERRDKKLSIAFKKKSIASNSYNVIVYALRFFYCVTLRRPLMKLELPTTKVIYKLPSILSTDEVQSIIKAAGNIKHKTLLILIYGAGLRVSEAVNLRTEDIDSKRMTIHIRCSKNRRDRYALLSPIVLEHLRTYWKYCRFTNYVFPGRNSDKHITTCTAANIYQQVKERALVKKSGGIHGLRTAFATHLLEAGVDLFVIKQLLGHSSIHSTVRYLSFVPCKNKSVKSPIDQLSI